VSDGAPKALLKKVTLANQPGPGVKMVLAFPMANMKFVQGFEYSAEKHVEFAGALGKDLSGFVVFPIQLQFRGNREVWCGVLKAGVARTSGLFLVELL
jgi:hypothetical protein